MTDKKTLYFDLIYLLSCGINSIRPNPDRVAQMDLPSVYRLSCNLSVDALTYYAVCGLLQNNELSAQWKESAAKALRKTILFDSERQMLFDFCEEHGITHIPLKGVLIQELYPALGMRQMSDNDIFFDAAYSEEIKQWFMSRGYQDEHINNYQKSPALNFELHDVLSPYSEFDPYYEHYQDRIHLDEGKHYQYHFSNEDFYIFFIIHAYKHYANTGTGIRTLLDYYVLNKAYRASMNLAYLNRELEKIGLLSYEIESRELSEKLFSSAACQHPPHLTENEQGQIKKYMVATYGTNENYIRVRLNRVNQKNLFGVKIRYVFSRLFPQKKSMLRWSRKNAPFVYSHPWLLPMAYLYRITANGLFRFSTHKTEIKIISKWSNDDKQA